MSRKKIIIAIILNLLNTILTFTAILFCLFGNSETYTLKLKSFRYFTIDSTILMAFAAAFWTAKLVRKLENPDLKIPEWAYRLKFIATVNIDLSFLTVLFFLAPRAWITKGFPAAFAFFNGTNIVMHLLSPILSTVSLISFCGDRRFSIKDCFLSLIPPAIYAVVYVIMVCIVKLWNDYYGFTFGGRYQFVPVVMAVFFAMVFLIAFLLKLFRKRSVAKESKK
ncbi:MAG: hypothetical protein IIU46_02510 [Treponema sp.]|nr:hypothetical protein [Treponema sp.]